LQSVEPLALLHAAPHAPQLAMVFRGASQPLPIEPSQLPNPALHVIEHAPREQEAIPFTLLHAALQAPQCARLVWVLVSQPLGSSASQFPKPALQEAMAHEPVEHVATAFMREQGTPHPPQFVNEVNAVSHPLELSPSQLPTPGLHTVHVHTPAAQAAEPPGQSQMFPHVPQWFTLLVMSVSHPL